MKIKNKYKNKVYVFIDASNIWQAQKSKGRMFDYKKLKLYLKNTFKTSSIDIFYYSAYPANGTRDYNLDNKHKFFTFLSKGLGFIVRKKELKRIKIIKDNNELIKEKGDMDVEITIDAIHNIEKYNIAIFFSGDSDFIRLVTYLRNNDKKVYIYSSKNNISEELRTGGDGYTDVLSIKDDIWGRNLSHRKKNK